MSLRARLLNRYLKWVERPALARLKPDEHQKARRRFALNMRMIYGRPKGAAWVEIAGVRCLTLGPETDAAPILYFHGGGYVFGDPVSYHGLCGRLARAMGRRVIIPDYPLAPEHPFPAAPDAALAVYTALAAESPVILGGDSAGGGLALSLLGSICKDGLPQPAATFVFSPLADLTFSGESMQTNAASEAVLPPNRIAEAAALYLNGADLSDPRATPLNAGFTGAGPVRIWVGTTEILLDDSRRMAARLKAQGVSVTLTEGNDLPHVWPLFAGWQLPESTRTIAEVARFVQTSLDSASR